MFWILRWYSRNYDAIPTTWAQSTQRGMHLFFNNAPGLRCSTGSETHGIAPRASMLRAERGFYCIWWKREGLPFEDNPLADWPDWLLAEAMRKPRLQVYPSTPPSSLPPNAVVAELTAALFELDPCDWRSEGSQESYDGWLALMMACKAAGIAREDWIEWCMGDECYADDEEEIGRKWDGAPARHADALFKALAKEKVGLSREVQRWRSAGDTPVAPWQRQHCQQRDLLPMSGRRSDGLLRWLRRKRYR